MRWGFLGARRAFWEIHASVTGASSSSSSKQNLHLLFATCGQSRNRDSPWFQTKMGHNPNIISLPHSLLYLLGFFTGRHHPLQKTRQYQARASSKRPLPRWAWTSDPQKSRRSRGSRSCLHPGLSQSWGKERAAPSIVMSKMQVLLEEKKSVLPIRCLWNWLVWFQRWRQNSRHWAGKVLQAPETLKDTFFKISLRK